MIKIKIIDLLQKDWLNRDYHLWHVVSLAATAACSELAVQTLILQPPLLAQSTRELKYGLAHVRRTRRTVRSTATATARVRSVRVTSGGCQTICARVHGVLSKQTQRRDVLLRLKKLIVLFTPIASRFATQHPIHFVIVVRVVMAAVGLAPLWVVISGTGSTVFTFFFFNFYILFLL